MPTTSLIDFYIDKVGKMEYWCFGIDKLFSTSKTNQTNIDWNVSLNNHISRPISINNKVLYFFILHKGKIINFLYSKATENLKSYQFSGEPILQMTCAFQNDIDGGPPFFPRFRAGKDTYVNSLSYSTIQSMEKNEIFDLTHMRNQDAKEFFNSMEPNDNPILFVTEKK